MIAVYSSLGGLFFLLTIALQNGVGYSPLEAGAATLPVTALLLVLSPLVGELVERQRPRFPMTVGPLVAAGAWIASGRA
ncbi:MAG: hypothetical protein U5R31_15315 [Acidimicrobiia bacterium]|nr:hypothetical protein [Acidimicrobiia bacterium]